MMQRLIRATILALAAYGCRTLYHRFARPMQGASIPPDARRREGSRATATPLITR